MRGRAWQLLIALLLAAGTGCVSRRPPVMEPVPRPELPLEVAEAIEEYRVIDNRPHEFILYPREERRRPLVSFDRVLGWRMEAEGNGGAFERTDDQQLWGPFVGRVELPAGVEAILRPPQPLPLRDRFDSVSVWVKPSHASPRNAARARELSVLLRDADGTEIMLPLGAVEWDGWHLIHLRVPAETLEALRHPCVFVGLHWSAAPHTDVHYLDSLSFYTEQLAPLSLSERPRVPIEWPPGYSPGLHTGDGTLPFPANSQTVIPTSGSAVRRPQLEEVAKDLYRFSGLTEEGPFAYRVDARGGAPIVHAEMAGGGIGTLFQEGGIQGARDIHEAVAVSRQEGARVRIEYTSGAWYQFELVGRSLVVDAFLRAGEATHFEPGPFHSALPSRRLSVPGAPTQLTEFFLLEREEGPVFVSRLIDAARSGASEIEERSDGLGAPRYHALHQGRRGDLYERLVLTVASRIEDGLPTIAHEPSGRGEELAVALWAEVADAEEIGQLPGLARAAADAGMVNILVGLGEAAWRDSSENTTYRTRPSERFGLDSSLTDWLAETQDHGWRVGLDLGYREISPLNQHWSPDHVLRDERGGWREGAVGRYRVKPAAALMLQEIVATKLAERYAPGLAYLGALTGELPWRATDFDDRVPGAGRFSQAWFCRGELVGQERARLDAPVVGRGGAWFFAGLLDGIVSGADETALQAEPYLPVYELNHLHPLSVRFGLGEFPADLPEEERSDWLDRLLAGQVVYGRNGKLPPWLWGEELRARAYYGMQAVQRRYAGRRAERIAYWDGERYVSVSQALRDGAVERSQVYVLFENGLEVWVNGSAHEAWPVRVGRTLWSLPPFGWAVAGEGLLALSATIGDGRVDFVKSADYLYWDGRGSEAPYAEIASGGPLVIRVVEEDGAWMLDVRAPGGTRRFGVGDVIQQGAPLREAVLFGKQGVPLGHVAVTADEAGLFWVESEAPVYRALFPLGGPDGEAQQAESDSDSI